MLVCLSFFHIRFGERFLSISHLYDAGLRQLAKDIGKELGYSEFLREGTYVMVGGPSFETPAELRLLSGCCDVVGKAVINCCYLPFA